MDKLSNPNGPKTKEELWGYLSDCIDQEGFHYALADYTSPDYSNCDVLDPKLAKMWKTYLEISREIEQYLQGDEK